jgi:hypothetical protein
MEELAAMALLALATKESKQPEKKSPQKPIDPKFRRTYERT